MMDFLCENIKQLPAFNCFNKKFPSLIFGMVLNMPLNHKLTITIEMTIDIQVISTKWAA